MELEKKELESLYKEKTAKQIALEKNLTEKTVRDLLKHYEISKPLRNRYGEAVDKSFALVLYKTGYTISEIAKELDSSYNIISNIVKSEYKSANKATLERLFCKERKNYKEIGEILGISETTVWRWIRRFKLVRSFKPSRTEFNLLYKTMSIRKLSKHYNVSLEQIKQTIKKYNSKLNPKVRTLKYTKKQIENLYRKTPNISDLSKILGVCEYSVCRILRNFDIEYPHKVRRAEKYIETDVERERVYTLYRELIPKYKAIWVKRDIAEILGVSVAEVTRCLKTIGNI